MMAILYIMSKYTKHVINSNMGLIINMYIIPGVWW